MACTQQTRSAFSPSLHQILGERDGLLPVWIRAPVQGPEHYTGITRPKLYQLAAAGKIRTACIREPGRIRGVRLFNLNSILEFIEKQSIEAEAAHQKLQKEESDEG